MRFPSKRSPPVAIMLQRLGVCKGREWRPNEAAKKSLAQLGKPLGVFRRSSKRNEEKEVTDGNALLSNFVEMME